MLDKDPSPNMLEEAERSKKLKYQMKEGMEVQEFDTIQIYTASQILEGVKLDVPPVMLKIKEYKKLQRELFN